MVPYHRGFTRRTVRWLGLWKTLEGGFYRGLSLKFHMSTFLDFPIARLEEICLDWS